MKTTTAEEYDPNQKIEEAASVADGTEAEVFFTQVATFLKQFADNGGFTHRFERNDDTHIHDDA